MHRRAPAGGGGCAASNREQPQKRRRRRLCVLLGTRKTSGRVAASVYPSQLADYANKFLQCRVNSFCIRSRTYRGRIDQPHRECGLCDSPHLFASSESPLQTQSNYSSAWITAMEMRARVDCAVTVCTEPITLQWWHKPFRLPERKGLVECLIS